MERPARLHDQRLEAVVAALAVGFAGAKSIIDLGCGEGRLIQLLVKERQWDRIVGMDVSSQVLKIAGRKLHLDREDRGSRERITLLHGSLLYRDDRLAGFDAAAQRP